MKDLFKNTSIMGSTKILVMAISIIRNKYLAIKIGPDGYGVYNLLLSFFHLGDILAGTSLGGATLKYIAEYNSKGEKEKVEAVFNISFFIVFLLVSVVTLVFNVFFNKFRSVFLSPEVSYLHYALFSASYFLNIIGGVFEAGIKGLIKIKDLALRSIISSVIGIISLFICVHYWGLNGFFANLVFVSLISAAVLFLALQRSIKVRIVVPSFKNSLLRPILRFSFADMFSSISNVTGDYIQRKIVVSAMSVRSLGLYSAASSLTSQLSIVSASAQSYMFPKMSEDLDLNQRDKVFSDYTKLVSLALGFASPVVVLFCPQIVKLLYSSEFASISDLMYWFLFGILFQSIQVSYLWTIYGMARLKIFTPTVIVTDILAVVLPWLFIRKYGLIILPISGIICSVTRVIIWSVYLRRYLGIWLAAKAYRYTLIAFISIFIAHIMMSTATYLKVLLIIAIFVYTASSFKKKEYLAVLALWYNGMISLKNKIAK